MNSDQDDITDSLNPRQVRFCQEYVIDLNQTQAYIRAGYSDEGAEHNASRLIRNDKVKAYISGLQRDKAKRLEITADKVLAEISRLAFSNVKGIFSSSDGLLRVAELDDDTAAAITSVKVTKKQAGVDSEGRPEYEDVLEYKLADKKAPLEMLAKHLELLVDRSKVDMNITDEESMLERMRQARERVQSGAVAEQPTSGPDLQDNLNPEYGNEPE